MSVTDDDQPMVTPRGTKQWFNKKGQLHRIGGPAVIRADGAEEWYLNGNMHRDDGPAVIEPNGYEAWYKDDKMHRTDGPARTWPDGQQDWALKGFVAEPLIPILWAAGATLPWHHQPEVIPKLDEKKKDILKWLIATIKDGGDSKPAILAMKKIGVTWPELDVILNRLKR